MSDISKRFTSLSQSKRDLLSHVLKSAGVDGANLPILPRAQGGAKGELPLSYAQESLWFMSQLAQSSAVYNLPAAVRLLGRLDITALRRAFFALAERHEILRTVFPSTQGRPRQEIRSDAQVAFHVVDLGDHGNGSKEERLSLALSLAEEAGKRPFDLASEPPWRVIIYRCEGDEDHVLLWVFHHLVWDGWSIGVALAELGVLYGAMAAGHVSASALPPLPVQYADYALWQRQWLSGEALAAEVSYWKEALRRFDDQALLPTDRPRPPVLRFTGDICFVALPGELGAAVEALSAAAGVTVFMTLLAAFELLLACYGGRDRIMVGTPVANRERREIEGLIGYFANIVVVPVTASPHQSFIELLGRVKEVTTGAYAHQALPFEMLVQRLGIPRDPSRNPLFQVMFALHQEALEAISLPGLTAQPVRIGSDTSHFDLGLHLWRKSGGFQGYISYNAELFEQATILRMVAHYVALLADAVARPEQPIGALSMLPDVERAWLDERGRIPAGIWEARGAAFVPVHRQVAERAAAEPKGAAVVYTDAVRGEVAVASAAAVEERAAAMAAGLLSRGLTKGAVIGLSFSPEARGLDAVAALLGVLKAGAAWARFGSDEWSVGRCAAGRARVTALIGDAAGTVCIGGSEVPVLAAAELAAQGQGASVAPVEVMPHDRAYVSYAAPAPVIVTHGALARRVGALQARFALAQGQSVAGDSSSAVLEILWPLASGGCAILPVAAFAEGLEARAGQEPGQARPTGETLWPRGSRPPDYIHAAPETLAALAGAAMASRAIVCSGGRLSPALALRLRSEHSAKLVYLYNPPEVELDVCATELAKSPVKGDGLTLAAPEVGVVIRDHHGGLAPIGVTGVISIVLPEAADGPIEEPAREVLTSDRGRWMADGSLVVMERSRDRAGNLAERTIWTRGARRAIADVEDALLSHDAVLACHVWARYDGAEDMLVAYAVLRRNAVDEIRAQLSSLVPAMPVAVVPVSSLPIGEDGTIDTRALAAMEVIHAVPPGEKGILRRWEQELAQVPGVEHVKVLAVESRPERDRERAHLWDIVPRSLAQALDRQLEGSGPPSEGSGPPSDQNGQNGQNGQSGQSGEEAARAGLPLAPLALKTGHPLLIPENAPKTLSEALLCTASAHPDRGITVVEGDAGEGRGVATFISYPELVADARRILTGLRASGVHAGDRVILQLGSLRDHFAVFWACVLGGIAPVTVATPAAYDRKSSVVNKLWNVWHLLRQPTVICNLPARAALRGVPALYRDDATSGHGHAGSELAVLAVEELRKSSGPWAEMHACAPEDVVFLQLTSGSTGIPKCIQETHRGIIHHIHGSSQHNGYTSENVTLNWLPMDHVVPILTFHLKDTYLGLRQIHVKTDLILTEPLRWLDLMAAHRVTHTWAPNFGFKLVTDALASHGEGKARHWDLSSVVYFMNAGEQVTLPVVSEFLRKTAAFGVRPQAMQPAFGMAEVCTCMTYANDFTPETGAHTVHKGSLGGVLQTAARGRETVDFIDLGPPMPGVEIRIAGEDGKVVPEGVIGVLQIRGAVTTPGYLANEEANREAFVGDGWFSSGDLGFIKNGRLTLTGRQKEMIIIRGANFYCYEIEDVVSSVPGVLPTFAAACAVADPGAGTEGLAVFFVPAKGAWDAALITAVTAAVSESFGIAPAYVIPLAKEQFPKTTSGKIQRTRLRSMLSAGELAELQKQIDIALDNERAVPKWFFSWQWRRKEAAVRPMAGRQGPLLLFAGNDEGDTLGEALGAELAGHVGRVIRVKRAARGAGLVELGQRSYAVDPADANAYRALFRALEEEGARPQAVIVAWALPGQSAPPGEPESPATCAMHLVSLAKALAEMAEAEQGRRRIPLIAASTRAELVLPGDRVLAERAALGGLVASIVQEWPALDCRHVDVDFDLDLGVDAGARQAAMALARELMSVRDERLVAYRGGVRYVPRLSPVDLSRPGEQSQSREQRGAAIAAWPGWLMPGQIIAVTGGLGGVGIVLAGQLLRHFGARLLLLGQTNIDHDEAAAERGDALATRMSAAERKAALSRLCSLGEVIYRAVDICDESAVRAAVLEAETRFGGPVAGAIHLAGRFPTRLLAEETPESFAATLAPKVVGAQVLDRVLSSDAYLIAFGSIYDRFGSVGTGAYSAANRALEAFVSERRAAGRPSVYLGFSHWDNTGMSRGYALREASIAQGYAMISPQRGFLSLIAALAQGRDLAIGLDVTRPSIRGWLADGARPAERLIAYVSPAAAGEAASAACERAAVTDRFGTPSRCQVVPVAKMPVLASGEIDVARLAAMGEGGLEQPERVLARSSLERTIAAIWSDVLGRDSLDIHTSFFALGGQSILMVQVLSKLKQAAGRELSVIDLFRYPTIASLASYLGESRPDRPAVRERALDRAQKQKSVQRSRVRPKLRKTEDER